MPTIYTRRPCFCLCEFSRRFDRGGVPDVRVSWTSPRRGSSPPCFLSAAPARSCWSSPKPSATPFTLPMDQHAERLTAQLSYANQRDGESKVLCAADSFGVLRLPARHRAVLAKRFFAYPVAAGDCRRDGFFPGLRGRRLTTRSKGSSALGSNFLKPGRESSPPPL